MIPAVGYRSGDVAAVLDPSISDNPASWQINAESGRRTWIYNRPDLNITLDFIDTSRADLDETLQENVTAVLFVGNLACYDEPAQQATNYIQGLLDCFTTLRSTTSHLPMIFILRGTKDFRARQQETPLYCCFPDGDGDTTHEPGEVAGMKLLLRKINRVSGPGQGEADPGKRGEMYLHFADDQDGGALDLRFLEAAVKEVIIQNCGGYPVK
ncbi:uncharacterized protein PgNI_07780 [Pyricularia grisea]|uniref:Uncharacterized protein n=1 Tax=Pyricularia grisea TaxID=148305 RepID=A0A6P8B227_PYRGI|nr:uncharacterized protein PgNI_07780 [Pyricularia grisea]TLD08854.1 hypothetical protein PgNI_07780 [Pyricularia grisea]